MGIGDVLDVHLVPRPVWDALPEATAAGCSHAFGRTTAWLLHRQTLLLWSVGETDSAQVRRLVLSEPVEGDLHVEVVTRPASSVITVLACSAGGLLHVWLDASFLTSPHCEQLACSEDSSSGKAVVTAMGASAADQGTSPGFMATISTVDGALHVYHGTSRGIFPRQFHGGLPNGSSSSSSSRQHGLFGTLGTVVKAMYSEAFDPLAHSRRHHASRLPARRLLLASTGSSSWRLYVLTQDALDCWQLGTSSGNSTTEQLLWSHNLPALLLQRFPGKQLELLDVALAASHSDLFVWSYQGGEHALHHLRLVPDATPDLMCSCSLPSRLSGPERHPSAFAWRLQPHSSQLCCLAHAPGGVLLALQPQGRQQQQVLEVSSNEGTLAVCGGTVGGQPVWQLLNSYHGVVDLEDVLPSPVSVDSSSQVTQLLDTLVAVLRKDSRLGSHSYELVASLNKRLSRLGLWSGPGGRAAGFQLLKEYSRQLVDSPPVSGIGNLTVAVVKDQLVNKCECHEVLLAALSAGGVLQQLSSQERQELQQHAEMAAAVLRVLDAWVEVEIAAKDAAGRTEDGGSSGSVLLEHDILHAMLSAAGEAAGSTSTSNSDLVYNVFQYPTMGAPALLAAAKQQVEYRPEVAGGHASDWEQLRLTLLVCGTLLLEAVAAAVEERGALEQSGTRLGAVEPAGGTSRDWLLSEQSFQAWLAISTACVELQPHVADADLRLELAAAVHLPAVRNLLGCGQALLGRVLLKEQFEWLAGQQLDSLLEDADLELQTLRARGLLSASATAAVDMSPAAHTAMVWSVEQLAAQYYCWPQLHACCELLGAAGLAELQRLLEQHMRTGRGTSGKQSSFAFWLMEKLRQEGNVAELLSLGPRGFLPQLLVFLQHHPALLWQAQVAAGKFEAASTTLLVAAKADGGALPQRMFMAGLARLGAYAAAPTCGYPAADTTPAACRDMSAADVLLWLTQLQRELSDLQQGGEDHEQGGADANNHISEQLSAAGIARAALAAGPEQDPEAATLAVKALTLVPEDQQAELRDTWQAGWSRVLQSTPVAELLQRKGQSSGNYQEALNACPLAQAVLACCHGLAAVGKALGARAGDIGPMLQDVEEILLQAADHAARIVIQDVLAVATLAASS